MFTHLHLHTDFSLLDSVIQIPALIPYLQELGMKSCAITDHGNLYGAVKFQTAMQKAELKPIIGCEIYISPRSMILREHGIDNEYYHLVLLSKNMEGYKNLIKIVSIAHMEGFYYKPRIDFETLKPYAKGLIAQSACLAGVISQPIMNNNLKLAKENLEKYAELFKDNFYIEIQRNGLKVQEAVNLELLKYAKEYKLPLVATCDSHYLKKEDSLLQETLWCIRDGKTLDDPTHLQMGTEELYVKSEEEMTKLFEDIPDAVTNTQKIVDQIEPFEMTNKLIEPKYLYLPKKKTSGEYLRELVYQNAPEKYGDVTEDLKKRLDYELNVIDSKGYNDYFLIVRDFLKFCHDNGIVVGIRGSGCGSAVAYCIDITHVEPISWELYFERFLNPERPSPPDFDIDIADSRRDEVIDYAVKTFGKENVRQIGTFSKLQTRQAIRDISRVLGIDLSIANALSKMVEIEFGKSKSIDYMIENNKDFANIINSAPELIRMSDMVRKLNGVHRGVSTHACGIIITPQPVIEYAPIQRDAHGGGMGMTQYEMSDTEYIGLMKYDFLGLKNLSVIGRTVERIKTNTDPEFDLSRIDYKDKDAFDVIRNGHTVGVFQMEGEGMKKVVRMVKPSNLEEVSYVLAAYRPGPMQFIPEYVAVKNKTKDVEYLFPELESILKVTNGVITYQEQVIRIAVDIAGYTMGSADMLRKAMGKKKMDVMEQERPKFIDGAVSKGFAKEKVEELWNRLVQFANYGFNKAHSASYAYVTYWTAYLKAHYPVEFMASLLECDLTNFNRVTIDIEECQRLGIKVLPPDINKSQIMFSFDAKGNIIFGLRAIKNVGEETVSHIVEERNANGEYLNLDDFIYRVLSYKMSVKDIEYIMMAGATDSFGQRESLIKVLPALYEKYKKQHEIEQEGQFDMFSNVTETDKHIRTPSVIPTVEIQNKFQRLQWEKDLLGLYMSSHPLDDFEEFFIEKNVCPVKDIQEKLDGEVVLLGGILTQIKRKTTKNGDSMAFVTLEDKTGQQELVVFPRAYERVKDELKPEVPILFAGRVNIRDDSKSIFVEKAKAIDIDKYSKKFDGVIFKIRQDHTEEDIIKLKKAITANSGDKPVKIISYKESKTKIILLNNKIVVNEEIKALISEFS